MKRMLLLVLPIVLLMGSISSHAQMGVSGCTAAEAVYFEAYLYPVFEDYTALREAFMEAGNIGQAGGELIALRAQLTTALEDSPACLDAFALDFALSMANMQTGILFLILSFEMDDPALSERFQQMGLYYGAQSDVQYAAAAETISGWNAESLTIQGEPGAGYA
jgi:hypothetical protein